MHEEVRWRRAETQPQCSHTPRWWCFLLAIGCHEELQQSTMPSGLQIGGLERLEQMQC
jgi:hypothetical protein